MGGYHVVSHPLMRQPPRDVGIRIELPDIRAEPAKESLDARLQVDNRPIARGMEYAGPVIMHLVERVADFRMRLQERMVAVDLAEATHPHLGSGPIKEIGRATGRERGVRKGRSRGQTSR